MNDFAVGDRVYVSDWCEGTIVNMNEDGALVECDTEFGRGTLLFEYDDIRLAVAQ